MSTNFTGKRGLGRGLSALMSDIGEGGADERSGAPTADRMVPIEKVFPNPDQPRRRFSAEQIEELAASIAQKGIIQPLIVRPRKGSPGEYEIVAGERRWRAAQIAKLHEIPVLVRNMNDAEVLEVAVIENIQRADLNPIEESMGFMQLIEKFGHTQGKLSEIVGKSRSHIANSLRLLQLPEQVRNYVLDEKLSAGHARALITSDDPISLADHVISKGLSVRETERLVKNGIGNIFREAPAAKSTDTTSKDADTRALEADLAANLGMKVELAHPSGQEKGQLKISYTTLDQLDVLCRLLSSNR